MEKLPTCSLSHLVYLIFFTMGPTHLKTMFSDSNHIHACVLPQALTQDGANRGSSS